MKPGRVEGSDWEPWSLRERQLLQRCYPAVNTARIAAMLGRSIRAVHSQALRMGLEKDARRLKRMGRENRLGKTKLQ